MQIKPIETENEKQQAFTVLSELRPHLTWDSFHYLWDQALTADRYCLVGFFESNRVIGVIGYRFLFDFVHGKHLYVDDLVVTEGRRSTGCGAELLRYAERIAVENQCQLLRLSTGIENLRGKKFYEKEGWTLRSVTYKKPLPELH